jgi:signal peptidase I
MTESITGSSKHSAREAAVSADVALAETPGIEVRKVSEVPGRRARPLRALVNLLHDLAIAVIICIFLITYVVQAFKVQGSSMAPRLVDGERILVNKFIYRFRPIQRGDVVVFWYPEDPEVSFIKRVVAIPGDRIEIVSGRVLVNDEPLDEPYVEAEFTDDRSYPARAVRGGHYFVLGDNRQGSNDSRSWGLVPQRYIYGKAFLLIWPLTNMGTVD